jgi:hypothetical protein
MKSRIWKTSGLLGFVLLLVVSAVSLQSSIGNPTSYGSLTRLEMTQMVGKEVFDETNGVSRLSRRNMENILGGFEDFPCCDNCDEVSDDYWECYHEYIPTCETTGCIHDLILTDGCEANQGPDADGCDAAEVGPGSYMIRQDIYVGSSCSWQGPSGWRSRLSTYYGCDTCHGFRCTKIEVAWACETLLCIEGTITDTMYQGMRYECDCMGDG